MKRALLIIALLVAGCSGSNLDTSRGPNGETITGNAVSVQVTNAANTQAAFSLAENYCRDKRRSARLVTQTGTTAAVECVKTE
jgi:hypothetical protein